MEMKEEMKNYIKVWISAIASLTYCYFISFNIPKGKLRFLSLIPVFFLLTTLPLNLNTVSLGGTTVFLLTWLANLKLILFIFGEGTLSTKPSISLSHFIAVACFPIKLKTPSVQNTKSTSSIKEKETPTPTKAFKSPDLLLAIKVFLCVVFTTMTIYPPIQNIHPKLMLVFHCCYLYLGVELYLLLVAFLIKLLLGLESEPPFNEPYMSTSLQDFWGRRWNLMVTNVLKPTVYDPTKLFLQKMLGTKWAAMLATVTTFIVSGIMHEVLFYYLTRASPTWEVTGLLLLDGVLLVLEILVKRVFKNKWRLHPLVSGAITLGIMVLTLDWLFFPQLLRCNVHVRSSEEILAWVNLFKSLGKSIRSYFWIFIKNHMTPP